MTKLKNILFICLLVSISSLQAAEMRIWKNKEGKTIEAEFLNFDEEKEIVQIRLKNGKMQRVKLSLFSEQDQRWVRNGGKETTDDPFGDANDESLPQKYISLRLHIDEYGNGNVQVEKSSELTKNEFRGTPIKLLSMPKTKIIRGKDSLVNIEHDFSDSDPIEALVRVNYSGNQKQDPSIKINKNVAELTSTAIYARQFKLPITISLDLVDQSIPDGLFVLRIGGSQASSEKSFGMAVIFKNNNIASIELNWGNKMERIFREESISINSLWKKEFRLPVPNSKITDSFTIILGRGAPKQHEPIFIKRMVLTGCFTSWLRIGYDPKDSPAFIRSVSTRIVDLKVGDLVKEINEKTVDNSGEMMSVISDIPLGDDIIFKIERRGEEKEVKLQSD